MVALEGKSAIGYQINKKITEPLDRANQQLSQADLILTIQSCVWTVRLINASFGSAKSRMMTNVRRIDHDEGAPVGSDSGVQRDELSDVYQ
jgi:hypothetical protein